MNTSVLKRIPRLKTQGTIDALILLGLVVLQQTLTLGGTTRLNIALNNSAHAPWFFVVTCLIWYCSGLVATWDRQRRLKWVAVSALVLSIGLEALQIFSRRDADLGDIGRNLLGGGSALCLILGLHWLRHGRLGRGLAAGSLAVLLMLGNFLSVFEVLMLNAQREVLAPQLITFNSPTYPLTRMLRGYWELIPAPEGNDSGSGSHSIARIDLTRSQRWPGIMIREPLPDWSAYQWLIIDAHADTPEPLNLEVRVETFTDRGIDSTITVELPRNSQPIRIPLLEITGSKNEILNNVRNLYLFTSRPTTATHFYLKSVSLE